MQALVKTGQAVEDLELKDWPEPVPAPDEVKLRVAAAGICGTDIHIIKGEWPSRPPVVLGHEFCGTVVEAGAQVRHFKPGDRIAASNPAQTCGECFHCRAGNPFMCPNRVSAGYMIDGAFAEYICIRAERCHPLPDNVSFRQAALGEPLSVAVHAAIERTTVHAGDLVVVSGPGAVGLLTMLVAKLEGARVIVSGIAKDRTRLALAKELGADLIVDSSKEDLLGIVRDLTRGEGAELVYECSGAASSLDLCWDAVKREGTLVQVGVYPSRVETDLNKVVMKELTLVGSYGYVWSSWRRSIRLLSEGTIKAEALISHEVPLTQFERAFRITQDGTAAKVVFKIDKPNYSSDA
jgi:L-iditol 2-dehydrogenase